MRSAVVHRLRLTAPHRLYCNWSKASCPRCGWLDDGETLTYLHGLRLDASARVSASPRSPMHLDALLADEPLTGGLEPRLGIDTSARPHHRRLPDRDHARSSSTNSIGLPFPIAGRRGRSCSTRPTAVRLMTRIRRQWFAKRKSHRGDPQGGDDQRGLRSLVDTDAANKASDADLRRSRSSAPI